VQIEILRKVSGEEFIVTLLDTFETQTHVELVLELMEGGELYARIATKGAFPEGLAATITQRLAKAVAFLHRNNIVHRDLKPENLLMGKEESVVKVRCLRVCVRAVSDVAHRQHASAAVDRSWPTLASRSC
jgi:serine/threonine protein kinase